MTETIIQDTMPVLSTQENSVPIGALQFSHHHILPSEVLCCSEKVDVSTYKIWAHRK
jgi:hypothetical protein